MSASTETLRKMAAAAALQDPHAAGVLWDQVAKAAGPVPWEVGPKPQRRHRRRPYNWLHDVRSQQDRNNPELATYDVPATRGGLVRLVQHAQRNALRGRTRPRTWTRKANRAAFSDVVQDLQRRGPA
jgi:hypothetical protein